MIFINEQKKNTNMRKTMLWDEEAIKDLFQIIIEQQEEINELKKDNKRLYKFIGKVQNILTN